ncbi:unnamed protein product, partial [Cladocopium goreaui]
LTSWDAEADLAAVRSWVPTSGAEKPKLDQDACDDAISCIHRLLRGEAANVDGCRDVFMVDPLVPTQACPAPETAVPLTQEAVDDQAPPAKRLRREKDLRRNDFSSNALCSGRGICKGRNVFRLGAEAGLASLGPQGGTWTGVKPPPEHEAAVVTLLRELFENNMQGVEPAIRKRGVAEIFDMGKCEAALALLR